MTRPKPNVVPGEAAIVARSYVFENRDAEVIEPREAVERMLAAGYGADISAKVRNKRLRTWALQVFRRLKKRGWLDKTGPEGWSPTAALRACNDPHILGKPVPRRAQVKAPVKAPPVQRTQPTPAVPPMPDSWEYFIQDWVFGHREREFGVVEVAVAVVQGGYGTGDLANRLDGAREIAERQLDHLEEAGLIELNQKTELWQPTELLRTWPTS